MKYRANTIFPAVAQVTSYAEVWIEIVEKINHVTRICHLLRGGVD